MRLGIVGGGVVGRATARAFIEHVDEVRVYDVVRERRTHGLEDVLGCDLVFVCLPTPQKAGERACDVSAIDDFFTLACNQVYGSVGPKVLKWHREHVNFVLRSTVPVGTTRRLREQYHLPNLVHSPEFLTARCAVTDAQLPARNVIGGDTEDAAGSWKIDGPVEMLHSLYHRRFPGVPVHVMTSDESEMVKLVQNGFFATKVAYFNEMRTLADKHGMNWERVLAAVLADGRIAHAHTKVPGPDGKFGFGPDTPNACLPKDISNLIDCIDRAGLPSLVTTAAAVRNVEDRKRTCA